MLWSLKHGKNKEWKEKLEAEGNEIPGEHTDAPILYQDLIPSWKAFIALSSSRQTGFGIGYIPISEIYAYMNMFYIDEYSERERLLQHVSILDSAYVKYQNEQTEKKNKSKKPSKQPRKR